MTRLIGVVLVAFLVGLGIGFFVGLNQLTVSPQATKYGRFLSDPVVRLLNNGREIELLDDFVYVDPDETPWLAPKDSKVNGASIPQAFWSLTQGPLSGPFRNASIVHDVACERKKQSDEKVHRMFFYACLAGGVPESKAKLMYWAVAVFGPKWRAEARTRTIAVTLPNGFEETRQVMDEVHVPIASNEPTEKEITWAKQYFENNNPSVDEIPFLSPPNEISESTDDLPHPPTPGG